MRVGQQCNNFSIGNQIGNMVYKLTHPFRYQVSIFNIVSSEMQLEAFAQGECMKEVRRVGGLRGRVTALIEFITMRPDRGGKRQRDTKMENIIVENEHKYKLHISHTFYVAHNAQ